jgi:hypothetical protein
MSEKFKSVKERLSCNSPVPSNRPGKKKMVKACANGKEKLIHFGAEGYGHCESSNDKLSARYWACKNLWTSGGESRPSPKGVKKKG